MSILVLFKDVKSCFLGVWTVSNTSVVVQSPHLLLFLYPSRNISYHIYADDIQLYNYFTAQVIACQTSSNSRQITTFSLNQEKTECVVTRVWFQKFDSSMFLDISNSLSKTAFWRLESENELEMLEPMEGPTCLFHRLLTNYLLIFWWVLKCQR